MGSTYQMPYFWRAATTARTLGQRGPNVPIRPPRMSAVVDEKKVARVLHQNAAKIYGFKQLV